MHANEGFRTNIGLSIFKNKYAISPQDTWENLCRRLVEEVAGPDKTGLCLMSKEERDTLCRYMQQFKFVPGGRYLYYAGRKRKYWNNCFLYDVEDSKESWSELARKALLTLSSGGGVGVHYSKIRPAGHALAGTGGLASGPIPLMHMINEIGRNVMQGGSRRAALYASLHYWHDDVWDFLRIKNWEDYKVGKSKATLKTAKQEDFNFPCPLDMTNISINWDEGAGELENNVLFLENVKQAMRTGEPGFSFNFYNKKHEVLRNPCVSGDTPILTDKGYKPIESCVGKKVNIWNGEEWSEVVPFEAGVAHLYRVTLSDGAYLDCTADHKWLIDGERIETRNLLIGHTLDKFRMPLAGGLGARNSEGAYSQGFYSGDGNRGYNYSYVYWPKYSCIKALQGDIVEGAEDGRRVWKHGPMLDKSWVPFDEHADYRLRWLAGLLDADGTVTRDCNGSGFQVASIDFEFLERLRLMLTTLGVRAKVVNARKAGSYPMPDGRGGIANYNCKEIKRLLIGNYDAWHLMQLGLGTYLNRLEHSGSKPQRDARQFVKVTSIEDLGRCEMTYCFEEPKANRGTFNGIVTGQCSEVVSSDDNDVCNLGSVNISRIETKEEFDSVVELGTKFLFCGSVRGELPHEECYETRNKNRRLGLGLMGIHEWLLKRGKTYAPCPALAEWLESYKKISDKSAKEIADRFHMSRPVATRAIAPTGSIGTMAGTTTGIEPLYAVAYKRRYLKNGTEWHYQYVIDNIADYLIKEGVEEAKIETSISLSKDIQRRINMQACVQSYVDQAISSTINLPPWGSEDNNELCVPKIAEIVAAYAPSLRGLTFYPEGARGGQPITPVSYSTAKKHENVEYKEHMECADGVCGA